MKKQTLLLLAGGLLTFAACNNEQAGGYSQEYVDSAVTARVMELQVQMQASNDSLINELAQWKADSMIAAAKGTTPSTPKPSNPKTTTPPTTTTPPPPPPPSNPKDDRFNGGSSTNPDKKDSRFDKDAAEREKDANAKKKEDRFKNR